MVTLLAKLFIRDHENVTDPGVRQAYGILCGIVGICFNLILFTTKALAGLFSHSIAITADAFNNLSDAASSIITLVGFRMAGQKPDSDHPFGHGRIEYISGLLVSILIVLMGFELVKSSVSKIFHPEAPDYSPVIIGILVFSIVVKCYMSLYNRRIGTRISSVAMKATAIDSLSDMVATTVVLIGTIVSAASGIIIDGYCGVLVGMFILYSGFVAAKDTISPLLGQPPEPELVQQINDIVLSYDNVIGIQVNVVLLIISHQALSITSVSLAGTIFQHLAVNISNRIEGRSWSRQVRLTNIQVIYMNSSLFRSFSQRRKLTYRRLRHFSSSDGYFWHILQFKKDSEMQR